MSSSRVSEVLISCARVPVDCCWGTVVSSSSSSERKKSDDGWFRGVLGNDSGWEDSCQLRLFKVEMVAVCEGMLPIAKLDLLLRLVLGKGQTWPLGQGFEIRGGFTPCRVKGVLR